MLGYRIPNEAVGECPVGKAPPPAEDEESDERGSNDDHHNADGHYNSRFQAAKPVARQVHLEVL